MSEAMLTVLKWCLLALLYLFFFRVLQATWFGSGASSKPKSPTQGLSSKVRKTKRRLVVLAPPALAGHTYQLNTELTMGRAAGCQITLDDTYISQLHARVRNGETGVIVEDLGSTNGTYLNRKRVMAPSVLSPGDKIQVGSTVLELR